MTTNNKFLGKYDPDDESINWSEELLQTYIAEQSRKLGLVFSSGLEGVKLTIGQAMKAKRCGMEAGEPDLRYYMPFGILVSIELKRDAYLSKCQKERHEKLKKQGFKVHVVKEKTPLKAWNRVKDILREYIEEII